MILNKSIAPTEGEISVKSYLCTSFNSFLFGIKANGYLEITNKRLLFQALGSGLTRHPSVIHSEVPISEVVGINIYSGKVFNVMRLIAGILMAVILIPVAAAIIAFVLSWLDKSPVIYQILVWILFLGAVFLAYFYDQQDPNQASHDVKDNSLKELLIIYAGVGAIGSMVKGAMSYPYGQSYGSSKPALLFALVAVVYALYRYSKIPAFSLMVHSKSGSNPIVKVTGTSPLGAASSAASKALSGKPAQDSLLVLKELGAVVLDIQNMGEYGIEKWRIKK